MKVVVTAFLGLSASAGVAVADMSAQLGSGRDGGAVPSGQQCKMHGGNYGHDRPHAAD